jgi:transposase
MLLRRKGSVFLKTALVTAAITGCRRRGGTHPAEKYRRLRARRGTMRAAVAIAHKILVSIWHMLSNGTFHQDPGPGFPDKMDRERTSKHLVRRLVNKGFEVQLREKAA